MSDTHKLFIIDGQNLIYKAFYAIKFLSNSKGEQTNAVYGFTSMILKLLFEQKPEFLLVAFDSKTPTFRHEKYKEYKAHRQKMPLELKTQLPLIMEVLSSLGINYYSEDGYEADDIIATLVEKYYHNFSEIILLANDKDILQLVSEKVRVYSTKKGFSEITVYDEEEIKKRYGVTPLQIKDVLSLMGDSSDNIPGVKGIGEKSAIKLIQDFNNLENLIQHLEEISPLGLREKIKVNTKEALLSKELVTLNINVPLKIDILDLKRKSINYQKLTSVFSYLEFYSFLERFKEKTTEELFNLQKITQRSELLDLKEKIIKRKKFAFSILASKIETMKAEILGISVSLEDKTTFLISFDLAFKEGIDIIKEIFASEEIVKYGYHLKESMILLRRYQVQINNYFDIMIAAYLLNPSTLKHNLENIASLYLNRNVTSYRYYLEKKEEVLNLDVESKEIKDYICQEVDLIRQLKEIFINKLKEESLEEVFYHIEIPLIKVLSEIEYEGIKIDSLFLKEFSYILQHQIENISKEIYTFSQEEFNLNSSKQLSEILFKKLKLPVQKKTKTGYSTDEEVLIRLSQYHQLPLLILKYRELSKLLSTYVEALPKLVNQNTGRLHTSYHQIGTLTGRLSSSNPNLQNIPIKTELGRKVRSAFTSEAGNLLISADYSQIELRILAHLSQDEELIEAFKNERDIHQETASHIFSLPLDKVTPEMRRVAKMINFGIIYGMSPFGLSKELNITLLQAQDYIETYFSKYPKIKRYMEEIVNKASKEGFVTTLWGRKRFLPEITSLNKQIREQAIRISINTPIQGTAADLIKLAMINLHQEIHRKNLKSKLILQIHDELILEGPKEELSLTKDIVKEIMENVVKLLVPLKVNIKTGSNGYEVLK
ncbi:MAG: DNA polymerase I [bacterium]